MRNISSLQVIWKTFLPFSWYEKHFFPSGDMKNISSLQVIWETFLPFRWYEKNFFPSGDMRNISSLQVIWETFLPFRWYEKHFFPSGDMKNISSLSENHSPPPPPLDINWDVSYPINHVNIPINCDWTARSVEFMNTNKCILSPPITT